ncbi:MAG: membrane dipeptidase [Bacteroidetes bacterium]|nr:membrane dipeptidase [Bacteroidota bacterium]NWJ51841.1 membrane dipeptidase [Bacteroidota bacterium]NWJ51854.1 membrane dipeptidase [Bacteroidota bacterium]
MNLKITLTGLAALVCFGVQPLSAKRAPENLNEKAARIHKHALTVDSHCDTPLRLDRNGFDAGERHDVLTTGSCVDYPRMKEGGLDGSFFAVFIGQGKCTEDAYTKVHEQALNIFKAIHQSVNHNSIVAGIAVNRKQFEQLAAQGKRAIFMGVENGYPIGSDITRVKEFYDLGARYITLCHTKNNQICDSSTDTLRAGGVTDFGRDVIKEMNRLGMMIDISHISDRSVLDVLKYSKAPVIASHSCAKAICNNPRNLNDDLLVSLKANGGVIQMCILSDYVKKPLPNTVRDSVFKAIRAKYNNFEGLTDEQTNAGHKEWDEATLHYPRQLATVKDVVDHIDHIVKVIGIDYVGIGTDFDGGGGVADCRDVSQMGNITLELVKRGYSEKDIQKIWSGNLMRVLDKVEQIARK